jgi:hypothetical protein
MDSFCNPSIVTAALFVSVIFMDLFRHDYKHILVHSLLGFFFVTMMNFLCVEGLSGVAWVILLLPIIFIVTSIYARNRKANETQGYIVPDLPVTLPAASCTGAPVQPYYM